jgi:hypothetical protein
MVLPKLEQESLLQLTRTRELPQALGFEWRQKKV